MKLLLNWYPEMKGLCVWYYLGIQSNSALWVVWPGKVYRKVFEY